METKKLPSGGSQFYIEMGQEKLEAFKKEMKEAIIYRCYQQRDRDKLKFNLYMPFNVELYAGVGYFNEEHKFIGMDLEEDVMTMAQEIALVVGFTNVGVALSKKTLKITGEKIIDNE